MRNQFNRKLKRFAPGIGKSGGSPFPTAGLTVYLTMQTYEDEGTTYYVNTKGNDVPVVGTDGGEDILDFSVLNDDRFNKGAVVGNAGGFPEYWDSPWNAYFYYDDTSAATLYHWKIKDFHYAYILEQSASVDNVFFLKALATTDTSNVIASIQKLLIYSAAQTSTNLAKLKTYIGIQDDFIITDPILNYQMNSVSEITDNGDVVDGVTFINGEAIFNGSSDIIINSLSALPSKIKIETRVLFTSELNNNVVFNLSDGIKGYSLNMRPINNTVSFINQSGSKKGVPLTSYDFTQYHIYTCQYDGLMQFKIDNDEITTTGSTPWIVDLTVSRIGNRDGAIYYLNGKIDYIKVFDIEIKTNYYKS